MLGRISSLRRASPGFNSLRQTLWGFFVSDDFRVSSRQTLNLGLRYEPYFGFRERNGRVVAFRPGRQSTVWPTAPQGQLFQGDEGVPETVFQPGWCNFAPRIGLAWDVFGNQKFAVRAGYGLFYDSIRGINLNRFPLNQPFLLDITIFAPLSRIPTSASLPSPIRLPPATTGPVTASCRAWA